MIGSTFDLAGLDGGRVHLTSHQLGQLSSGVYGKLLRAGDEGWNDAVLLWNGAVHRKPALVLQPSSSREVAAAVAFASDNDLVLSVKGGGHNIAGTALAEGGLVLDMSRMRAVEVDTTGMLAHVDAGCLLKHVDRATQQHGLATVLGMVSETGVAGLTLGGGFGYLSRRFGWTVDNLEAVEVVTADGQVRMASRKEHPDLFWALRGGGGNFGVATRFTFRLHHVGPTVTAGFMIWSGDRIDDVLAAYRDLTRSAPRELTSTLFVFRAPPVPFLDKKLHGTVVAAIHVCHSGTNAEHDLGVIRSIGAPLADLITTQLYIDLQSLFDDDLPKGTHYYIKGEYLPDLTGEFLEAFRDSSVRVPSTPSEAVIVHIGGALNERAGDDGAVGNRAARYIAWFDAAWPPHAAGDEHVAWAREAWMSVRRFSSGGNYVNFQTDDEDEHRLRATYGRNFDRLLAIKTQYDPTNLFRVNRNIRQSPARAMRNGANQ